jgi:hypothetical protein
MLPSPLGRKGLSFFFPREKGTMFILKMYLYLKYNVKWGIQNINFKL